MATPTIRIHQHLAQIPYLVLVLMLFLDMLATFLYTLPNSFQNDCINLNSVNFTTALHTMIIIVLKKSLLFYSVQNSSGFNQDILEILTNMDLKTILPFMNYPNLWQFFILLLLINTKVLTSFLYLQILFHSIAPQIFK